MLEKKAQSAGCTAAGAIHSTAIALKSELLLIVLIPLLVVILGHASAQASSTRRDTVSKPHSVRAISAKSCRKIELAGEINAGGQWSADIGQGWVFRILPIASNAPGGQTYSGWDLVVEAPGFGGYPDALLLGTPPYGSINEREIGTTFGLRAQDAIAWEPRHFHFLTSVRSLTRARELYRQVMAQPAGSSPASGVTSSATSAATSELLKLVTDGSSSAPGHGSELASGQLRILDARLTTGTADPLPFARQWAAHLHQVPHTVTQSGTQGASTASDRIVERGKLEWMRFAITLWLPAGWNAPDATLSACIP